ncbi:hypothetical protein M427DRAFT_310992 [Gonapodya prolifera JEL478]|uniref:Uncharacterized protein n=1 Tax=Gonapodya prolifera (strain JEL478) TaxID=1344416 RepID=A0A139AX93_GONPJ|nr:hypothetical protein M427DRAFT_310992 [Gonapodya prolifera JEL478]|eukprot:KXS21085.1 hypothetical protein M427DRAFT_310992 [Gonapodya prolifera JEL478]
MTGSRLGIILGPTDVSLPRPPRRPSPTFPSSPPLPSSPFPLVSVSPSDSSERRDEPTSTKEEWAWGPNCLKLSIFGMDVRSTIEINGPCQ